MYTVTLSDAFWAMRYLSRYYTINYLGNGQFSIDGLMTVDYKELVEMAMKDIKA